MTRWQAKKKKQYILKKWKSEINENEKYKETKENLGSERAEKNRRYEK